MMKKKAYIRLFRLKRPQSFHIKLRSRYNTISNCEVMLEAPPVILVHPPAPNQIRSKQPLAPAQPNKLLAEKVVLPGSKF